MKMKNKLLLIVAIGILFDMSSTLLISSLITIEGEANPVVKFLVQNGYWRQLVNYGSYYLFANLFLVGWFYDRVIEWKEYIRLKKYLFDKGKPSANLLSAKMLIVFFSLILSILLTFPFFGGVSWIYALLGFK